MIPVRDFQKPGIHPANPGSFHNLPLDLISFELIEPEFYQIEVNAKRTGSSREDIS